MDEPVARNRRARRRAAARGRTGAGARSVPAKPRPDGAAPLIGSSRAIKTLRERIERVAATDFTILVEGESGSGKELVARQIHELSKRRRGPFVAVNCAAIVETLLEAELFGIEDRTATGVRGRRGKFEHAHDGTLFLDEVSDLSPAAQAKLLRAIQDLSIEKVGGCGSRRVDTRVIVATNKPLAELVSLGRFRTDLYYRLNGVDVPVPPLRHRREDILELAQYFLDRYRVVRPLQLSQAASDALLAYDWPGNVRELERVMERAVALAGSASLELDDLPAAVVAGTIRGSTAARSSRAGWHARMGQSLCTSGARTLRKQQTTSMQGARHFVSHAAGASPIPRGHACVGGIGVRVVPGASGACVRRGGAAGVPPGSRGRTERSLQTKRGLRRRILWRGITSPRTSWHPVSGADGHPAAAAGSLRAGGG